MYFDVYSELDEEYRSYALIQPNQLNFRSPANDAERSAASDLGKTISQDSLTLFIIGGILAALGIICVINLQLGGIVLILFGIPLIVFGIVRKKQGSNAAKVVATGTLLKKESQRVGTVSDRTRRTFRWLVIAVEGMEKTLCVVHADPDNFDETFVGDKILVIDDKATYRGKKLY